MSDTITIDWINENYTAGWYLKDTGATYPDRHPMLATDPFDPIWHDIDGVPIYHPMRQRLIDHGELALLCRQCGEPSWAVSRHAVERHGADVQVYTGQPKSERPEWMRQDWL